MDWASRTRTQTTVTPAWTNPGYDPREADASPGGQTGGGGGTKKKKKHSKRASRLRTDSDITVQQNTYILFIFLLIFLNIMSDQKLSE